MKGKDRYCTISFNVEFKIAKLIETESNEGYQMLGVGWGGSMGEILIKE